MKRLLIFVFLLGAAFNMQAQNYFLGTSKDGLEELYIMSVTSNRSSSSMVVFDRIKPVEGKLADFRHNIEKTVDWKKVKTTNFDKLGYYRRKVQYSCSAKKYRIMECIYYELGGKVIETVEGDEDDTAWERIPAGSLIEAEFKKICKK